MPRLLRGAALLAAIALLTPHGAQSYVTQSPTWASGSYMVMELQLGTVNGTLIDGATSWNTPAETALARWNPYLDRVSFRVNRDSTASTGLGNGRSNTFWSSTVYGRDFDSYASPTQTGNILAVTTCWVINGVRTECDVIFRNTLSWNSYDGNLRLNSSGGRLNDIRRVALHEYGHVLGLGHPNDFGQNTTAIMNSTVSNLDRLAADDINGAQALWSQSGNGTIAFPPRNESLDFRNQLEAKYRDGLRRPAGTSYVDNEGDIVWTSEYFRYRVNQCSHDAAVFKVFNQIDGLGTLGVCGNSPSGQVAFPPRNEALQFRTQLEAKYRDELRRGPNATSVDNEGDVVWTQEYFRYRVNGCGHADAVQRVFAQLDGQGVQPVCR